MSLIERLDMEANDADALGRVSAADVLREAAAEIDRLNREVERWVKAYEIAHDQAMANGSALAELRASLDRQGK